MADPVTPEEYGLRAAKRQLKKDNASLVEQNLALRSKVSVLAAQVEEWRYKAAARIKLLEQALDATWKDVEQLLEHYAKMAELTASDYDAMKAQVDGKLADALDALRRSGGVMTDHVTPKEARELAEASNPATAAALRSLAAQVERALAALEEKP